MLEGSQKGGLQKGGFGGCSLKPEQEHRKQNDGHQKPERGYRKLNDGTKTWNEGTCAINTTLLQNRPFVSSRKKDL